MPIPAGPPVDEVVVVPPSETGQADPDGSTPPDNADPFPELDPAMDVEFVLPESEEVPPGEVQARLEAPTGLHWTYDAVGGTPVLLETAPVTEPGVVRIFPETDAIADRKDQLTAAESPITEGVAQ